MKNIRKNRKKSVLSFVIAGAMVLSMPAASFASDTLVNPDGTPANTLSGEGEWQKASPWDLLGDALLTAAASVDPSIVIEEDGIIVGAAGAANAAEADAPPAEGMRTVTAADLLADAGVQDVETAGDMVQTAVSTSSIGASRYSNTSGNVSASAGFTKKATTAKCTIILQQKSGDSWIVATGVPVSSYSKTVSNVYSISASKTFTLKSGKVYRARITFKDTNSSGTYTKTRTTGSF